MAVFVMDASYSKKKEESKGLQTGKFGNFTEDICRIEKAAHSSHLSLLPTPSTVRKMRPSAPRQPAGPAQARKTQHKTNRLETSVHTHHCGPKYLIRGILSTTLNSAFSVSANQIEGSHAALDRSRDLKKRFVNIALQSTCVMAQTRWKGTLHMGVGATCLPFLRIRRFASWANGAGRGECM